MNVSTVLGRLRLIGLLEGISFLLLLGIAMPLKYVLGIPQAVKAVGWAHGLLFVLYLYALAHAAFVYRWSLLRIAGGLIASVLPFGTLVFDRQLRKDELKAAPVSA